MNYPHFVLVIEGFPSSTPTDILQGLKESLLQIARVSLGNIPVGIAIHLDEVTANEDFMVWAKGEIRNSPEGLSPHHIALERHIHAAIIEAAVQAFDPNDGSSIRCSQCSTLIAPNTGRNEFTC